MNKYTITIQLEDKEQFQHFIDNIGPLVGTVIVKVTGEPQADAVPEAAPVQAPATPRAKRALRGSKVNTTILNALQDGKKPAQYLKQALEDAHLSPGSLSTGLAQLQKAGQVERAEHGLYALRAAA